MLTDSYINHLTGGSDAAITKNLKEEGVMVSQWETIHRGAILMAGAAITERSWAHLRQAEGIMNDAKAGFDPLVVAIMGVRAPDLSNRLLAALHTAGQHATADQIKVAGALIKTNAEQMEARRQKPVKAAPALKPAVKPHHQAIVAWLAINGPAKPDVVIDATGESNITIRAMVKDGIIWENRRGQVGI
jgi:hypothetical protein